MLLSIIIPFYNGRKEDIYRCLDSIYSQGLKNEDFEVIVVNDKSPDSETVKNIENYRLLATPPTTYTLSITCKTKGKEVQEIRG